MALRYLARKVGTPALRQASGPRVSPPAGARRLNSTASQGGEKGGGKKIEDEDIARLKAAMADYREAYMEYLRNQQWARRMIIGSAVAGLGVSALAVEFGK